VALESLRDNDRFSYLDAFWVIVSAVLYLLDIAADVNAAVHLRK